MKKRNKQTAIRILPTDEVFLKAIADHTTLNQSAAIRVAIREFAFNHGLVLREWQETLLCLSTLISHAKGNPVQNLDKRVAQAEKILKRNRERLLYFTEDYSEAETEVWLAEMASRRRMRQRRWPESSTSRRRPQR